VPLEFQSDDDYISTWENLFYVELKAQLKRGGLDSVLK
jgi:hypothetical protein